MIRSTILNPSWWVSTFLTTLVVMCFIVMIKRVSTNVPVLNTIAQEV